MNVSLMFIFSGNSKLDYLGLWRTDKQTKYKFLKKDKYYDILEKSEYQCLETKARSSQTPQKSWFESQGPAKRSVSYGLKTEFNIAYCHV